MERRQGVFLDALARDVVLRGSWRVFSGFFSGFHLEVAYRRESEDPRPFAVVERKSSEL